MQRFDYTLTSLRILASQKSRYAQLVNCHIRQKYVSSLVESDETTLHAKAFDCIKTLPHDLQQMTNH